LQLLEKTPLRIFGLSHFWVVEKNTTETPDNSSVMNRADP
jgi:hypothetical protein